MAAFRALPMSAAKEKTLPADWAPNNTVVKARKLKRVSKLVSHIKKVVYSQFLHSDSTLTHQLPTIPETECNNQDNH